MRYGDCFVRLCRLRYDNAHNLNTLGSHLIKEVVIARIRRLAETKQSPETDHVSISYKCLFRKYYLYESLCTLFTALPEGSIMFLNDASQAIASGVLHATEGTDGTQAAAESDGKCSVKMHL